MYCPRCDSEDIVRSHRRGVEKFIKHFIPRSPFRCRDCWYRFWEFDVSESKMPLFTCVILLLIVFMIPILTSLLLRAKNESLSAIVRRPIKSVIAVKTDELREVIIPPSTESAAGNLMADEDDDESGDDRKDVYHAKTDISGVILAMNTQSSGVSHPVKIAKAVKNEDKPAIAETNASDGSEVSSSLLVLKNIDHREMADTFKMMIESSEPIQNYSTSYEDDPPRFVIDLLGKWTNSGKSMIGIDNEIVKRIRIGEHADKLRLVLDLTVDISLVPKIEKTPSGLNLIIKKAIPQAAFAISTGY